MKASDIDKIRREDLPSIYHVASKKSRKRKSHFFLLIKVNLILLVIGSFSSLINFPTGESWYMIRTIVNWGSFLSLFISVFITLFLQLKGYEKEWYGARAIAESMKTLAWRFMMKSDKFGKSDDIEDIKALFVKELTAIKNESRNLEGVLAGEPAEKPLITDFMLEVRKMNVKERLQLYLKHRIGVEKNWYNDNAKSNEADGNWYYMLIYITQIFAILTALIYAINNFAFINSTGVLTTLAASILTWSQVKQFKILSTSYDFTFHELSKIYLLGEKIDTDKELSKFVEDSELAISREHTMWRARRVEI